MRKRYSRSYTVLSFLTMFSYRELPFEGASFFAFFRVNGARIVDQWGDVGTELMVYVDGDISLFLGYEKVEFLAPVYVGDFMEYHGWIEKVGNQSYTCKFEAWKVATQLNRTDLI